jgi:hypothetical protein
LLQRRSAVTKQSKPNMHFPQGKYVFSRKMRLRKNKNNYLRLKNDPV